MKFLIFVIALLFPWSAPASDWRTCAETHKGGVVDNSLEIGQSLCYDVDDDTNSYALNVSQCENFDILMEPDIDGAGSTAVVSMYNLLRRFDPPAAANSAAGWKIENKNLDGDPSTNSEALYGAAGSWVYVEVETDPAGDDARVMVHCNGS